MGYQLHITRADDWTESNQEEIKKDEWDEYVKEDVELTKTDAVSLTTPFGTLSMEGDFAIWNGSKNQVIFEYNYGKVSVNNPDEETIQKIREIAKRINSRVVGAEYEEY